MFNKNNISIILMIFVMIGFFGMLFEAMIDSSNKFKDEYSLGRKNYFRCHGKDFSIGTSHRDFIVSMGDIKVRFKNGITMYTSDCYWIDHYTDDYTKGG